MTLKQEHIAGWNGYVWESGDLSVGVVPELGGRIMSLQFRGEELFFTQQKYAGETFALSQLAVNKKNFGFRVWGGDKTWIAPEKLWIDKIPPLDLDAAPYIFSFDEKERRVTMVSSICRETGLQITREVQFGEGNDLRLTETIKNESQNAIQRGIWNVTQILRPFEIYFPCDRKEIRLYDDEAFQNCLVDNYLEEAEEWTGISCSDDAHFKFGAFLREGKVIALRRGPKATIAFSKTFPTIPKAKYAHGSHAEVYNSPYHPYCEIEIHSPLLTLAPGKAFSQSQEWRLQSFLPDIALEQIIKSITFSQF